MSLNQISLRQAGAADWPQISALLAANKLPLDGAQAHLNHYVLALSGSEVIGTAGAEVYGDIALLRSVAVAPGLHRQGVGKAMVGLILDEARRRGIRQIYLLSVTAPEYFAQFGFKRGPRELAPKALQASAEFQGACPSCAALMSLTLIADVKPQAGELPVAVLGAGPVGLAAAAHLIARGITPIILEAGPSVGSSLLDYGHVRLFSPWRYDVDAMMAKMLAPTGWQAPPQEELPLASEIVERVLKPFAALPQVAAALHLNTRVVAISREGFDKVKTVGRDKAPFIIRVEREGQAIELRARAVIDATGTWGQQNPIGSNGLPALGERELADAIFYGIPDVSGPLRKRYAGKRTLVVGAGHSAANALLALADLAAVEPKTRLAWAVRTPTLARVFGGGDADALPARGRLGSQLKALRDSGALEFFSGLRITALKRENGAITVEGIDAQGQPVRVPGIDEIVSATGQRPDLSLSSELRLKLDPWLESNEALGPLIDPNLHSCGTVRPHGHRELSHPEPSFYTLGVKSYGRAPTFLMATGFEQARSVAAALAGDLEAADRVELDLPETGVCSVGTAPEADSTGSSCCGAGPAPGVAAVQAVSAVPAPAKGGCGPKSCGTAAVSPVAVAAAPARCCG